MAHQDSSPQQVPFKVKTLVYMGHRQLTCVGLSLSCQGMQLYAPVRETLGQYVRLVFCLEDEHWLDVDALLISQTRRKDHYLWGLSFLNVPARAAQQLAAFVARASGQTAPPSERRPQRRGTSRYRVVRRASGQQPRPGAPRSAPAQAAAPVPEQRHVGFRTGTGPTIPTGAVAQPRSTSDRQEIPLPEPALPEPALPEPAPDGELLDNRSYLESFEEQESTPLEEIFRRAIDDLKGHRF